ncbi:MAG: flagellar assembly protein FliH [Treponema sp.]|nr:flagellar assembly protein FliH [Treponema sp.]
MAKAVFRPNELTVIQDRVMIHTPDAPAENDRVTAQVEEAEVVQEQEAYTGPTAEDLRREAEEFKARWENEKKAMMEAARAEADEIKQAADQAAAEEKQVIADEANVLVEQAKEEAEKIVAGARRQAEEIEAEIRKTLDDEKKEALEQSREAGRGEGYTDGKAEVDRLIQRTQTVLERAQDKRGEILTDTEQEIINLVLLISRKVIKVISESQREVIVSNVIQALRKVKDRGNIIIRVNLADVKLATEHTKDFIKMLEGVKSIQVVEDSSVDSGGCIIETDFGEIDARISSQLAELEAKILEISPIKSKAKPSAANSAAKAPAAALR